jgi:hypothetical protein
MYDVYTSGYYEFTKSSDLENFTVISGNSFDFSPRHGTIIPITAVEMQALKEKWMNTNVKSFTESKVNIYPNPANDFIEIEVEKLNPSKSFINIYDIVGKNLIKTQITDFKNVIDITKLPAGIYFAEVSMEGNKTVFQKFIKQ